MTSRDYYEILGVAKDAAPEDIKKAYRALSKEYHPDHGGDEEKFKELSEAYSTLSNPQKRRDYDNPMRNAGNPFEDIFNRFGGSVRQHRPDPNAPRRGRHIQMEHETPMHLFIFGGELKVSFNFDDVCVECAGKGANEFDKCTQCNGSGMITQIRNERGLHMQSSRPCPTCNGRGGIPREKCGYCDGNGTIRTDKEVVLKVPRGLREGQPIGAAGEGGHGLNGGPPGDLIVKIYMKYPNPDELTEEQIKVLKEL